MTLAAGQWVYGQGDEQTGLCAVLEGALRLEVPVGARRDVLIGFALAPTILGQSRRMGGKPRLLTTRAARPSQVLLLSDHALDAVGEDWPDLWPAVTALAYEELDLVVGLAAQLLALGPRARLAVRLLQLTQDGAARVTQTDLAELCGVTRKTANAELAGLERRGLVRRRYGVIDILDAPGLRRLAG